MTKRKLAEQVMRLLKPSLTEDFKLDIRDCMLAVGQIRDNYMRAVFFEEFQLGDRGIPSDFLSKLTKEVTEEGEDVVCNLGVRFVRFPKDKGLFSVLYSDPSRQFALYPMGVNDRALSAGTDIQHLDKKSYVHENKKLVLFDKNLVGGSLVIFGVIASEYLDEEDELPLPEGLTKNIIRESLELLMIEHNIPEDKGNNNKSE